MPRWGRLAGGGAAAAAIIVAGLLVQALAPPQAPVSGVAAAVDGDTIRLGGERVRLVGLDAPESLQNCVDAAGKSWACGKAAAGLMRRLVGSGQVHCAPSGRDRYRRVLARCMVEEADIGEAMVAAGLAVADGDYGMQEAAARQAGAGIWGGKFEMPVQWRREHGEGGAQPDLLAVIRSWFR